MINNLLIIPHSGFGARGNLSEAGVARFDTGDFSGWFHGPVLGTTIAF